MKKSNGALWSFLLSVCSLIVFGIISTAAVAQAGGPAGAPGGPGGPPPGAMPGGPGGPGGGPGGPGGPPGMSFGPPSRAAIYIDNGAENSAKEYKPGEYKADVKSDGSETSIDAPDLTSGDYTFNGIVVSGKKSNVTVENAKVKLGVSSEPAAKADGGTALSISEGAIVHLNHSDLTVDGAGRYVTNNAGNSTLVVNDSRVTQTGSNPFTTKISEPFSNNALLIYGTARANMSVGDSKTYYFNSKVTTEGWASLSTDACGSVDLYAYNTTAVAEHGGYGTYADFNCRVWLYGSNLQSAEIGAIISKSGRITVADGASTPADVLKFNLGKTTNSGSVITGGRNAVMIHAPDMAGEGIKAADNGFLTVVNSTLKTDSSLKSTRDYAEHISKATQAYINYVSGAALLIKSTSATVNFENAKIDSFSGVAVLTVLNSDSMGNFLHSESDGAAVKPIAITMKNMSVTGDVRHMDYQRVMILTLDNATLKGAVVSGSAGDWNKLWTAYDKKDCKWLQNETWKTFYGVRLTVKKGATWEVTGLSLVSSLTVEDGGQIKGKVQVDGKDVTPVAGQTYTGKIAVSAL